MKVKVLQNLVYQGVRIAKGDTILMSDDDIKAFGPEYVEEVLEVSEAKQDVVDEEAQPKKSRPKKAKEEVVDEEAKKD